MRGRDRNRQRGHHALAVRPRSSRTSAAPRPWPIAAARRPRRTCSPCTCPQRPTTPSSASSPTRGQPRHTVPTTSRSRSTNVEWCSPAALTSVSQATTGHLGRTGSPTAGWAGSRCCEAYGCCAAGLAAGRCHTRRRAGAIWVRRKAPRWHGSARYRRAPPGDPRAAPFLGTARPWGRAVVCASGACRRRRCRSARRSRSPSRGAGQRRGKWARSAGLAVPWELN